MKYMIASDLHGSELACRTMLEAFHREGAEKLVLLGDLLYFGPRNHIPTGYGPKAVITMLNANKEKLLCVRGNCDADVDQMVLEFPIMADYMILTAGSRIFYVTHGHKHNIQTPPPLNRGEILLHGHTHIPAWEPFGNENLYLNPGSIAMPKGDSSPGYMTVEDDIICWKTIDGTIYHTLSLAHIL